MKAQTPAVGILKRKDWGDAKSYEIACTCCDPEHSHNVWVEAEEDGDISVTVYTTTVTTFWSMNRWRQMWQLLTRGYVKSEVALIMDEQQTANYANALTSAVRDVKLFREKRKKT